MSSHKDVGGHTKKSKSAPPKAGSSKNGEDDITSSKLKLLERRRHPRFLLSREQFREIKTGKVFPVYDLSLNGLSIKIEEKLWKPGSIVQGILNLNVDSIEVSPRLIGYYDDRAALKIEVLSTYGRTVLTRALSPKRLGGSLQLVREKLPVADYWFHGVCNTDLLIRLNQAGDVARAEMFFSNFYWGWKEKNNSTGKMSTGICQSCGQEKREDWILSEEPVKLESIDLALDSRIDAEKVNWARGILEASPLEERLKALLLKKFAD